VGDVEARFVGSICIRETSCGDGDDGRGAGGDGRRLQRTLSLGGSMALHRFGEVPECRWRIAAGDAGG